MGFWMCSLEVFLIVLILVIVNDLNQYILFIYLFKNS